MDRRIACGDVVPGCKMVLTAGSEEELVNKVVAHAAKDHGIVEVTPEIAAASYLATARIVRDVTDADLPTEVQARLLRNLRSARSSGRH